MVAAPPVALDREQRAAAQADPGRPLLLLAGPGSGKTATLAERLAYLSAVRCRGQGPSGAIVALTFTRNAARELQHRLRERLGHTTADVIEARTFHSLGLHLLRDGWAARYLGWDRLRVATTGQMRRAAAAALEDAGLALSPDAARGLLSDAKLGCAAPGAWPAVRRSYDAWLHERQLIDVADMLVLPVQILRAHAAARADLQRRISYAAGDEGQDWNGYQAALLAYAGGRGGQITAVGDPVQAIYGGSSPRYLHEFPLAFPRAQVVALQRTYRLHAALLAVADAVAAPLGGAVTAIPARLTGPPPVVHFARSAEAELEWLVHEVQTLRVCGALRRWAEAVVLVRTRRERARVATALAAAGLPTRSPGQRRAELVVVTALMAWLALLRDGADSPALLQALALSASGAGPTPPAGLATALRASGPWTMDRLRRELPPGLSERQRRDLGAFVRLYDGLRQLMAQQEPTVALDALLERTGLLAHPEAHTQIAALRGLAAQEGDVGALQHLLAEEDTNDDRDAVRVSTIHAFKGNQAEVVFVAGLNEGLLPHRRGLQQGTAGLLQELRIFYVAVTRPRTRLYLSAGLTAEECGGPSRFLRLIPPDLLRRA